MHQSRDGTPAGAKHRDILVIIPAFNNPTYVDHMVRQLWEHGLRRIRIVDNASTYPPMRAYLRSLAPAVEVVFLDTNPGARDIFRNRDLYRQLPDLFCVTDPDLEFNPDLPHDFIDRLVACTERFKVGKAGFALDISDVDAMRDDAFEINGNRYRIWEWETQFWKSRVGETDDGAPVYKASIDTTFAVYNKKYYYDRLHLRAVRVAGNYTCRHLPWYRAQSVPEEEERFYQARSAHSTYRQVASLGEGRRRKARPILNAQRALRARFGLLCKLAKARLS